jgi:hypothetical protein
MHSLLKRFVTLFAVALLTVFSSLPAQPLQSNEEQETSQLQQLLFDDIVLDVLHRVNIGQQQARLSERCGVIRLQSPRLAYISDERYAYYLAALPAQDGLELSPRAPPVVLL